MTRWVLRLTTGRAEFCLAIAVAIYSLHLFPAVRGYNVGWLLGLERGFGSARPRDIDFARGFGFGAGATPGSAAAAESVADDEAAAGSGAGVREGAAEEASLKILCIRSLAAVSCALGCTVSV